MTQQANDTTESQHVEGQSAGEARLLDHDYDGIREYDNPMPRWWRWIFWASFYFAIGYVIHYHLTGNGASVQADYEADLAVAREAEALALLGTETTEASLSKLVTDTAMMADAAKLFTSRCGVCHGARGEGLIGPNLTDAFWINGDASLLSLHTIIDGGVLAKGMPAWNRQLRPIEVAKLAAYVGSIKNTNLPGPKGAEGRPVTVQ
jgi:cytochrome c oxidase cbb3-type subunit III